MPLFQTLISSIWSRVVAVQDADPASGDGNIRFCVCVREFGAVHGDGPFPVRHGECFRAVSGIDERDRILRSAAAVFRRDGEVAADCRTDVRASELEAEFDESSELKSINSDIYTFLSTPDSSLKTFSGGDVSVTGAADSVQAFYSEEKKMVFLTPSDTEYPGNEYIDLF